MTVAWKTLAAMLTATGPLAFTVAAPLAPLLIWNTTASAPIGFYRLVTVGRPKVGDLVAAAAPEPLATWFDRAGYLPRGVPLVKRIAAVAGQKVCRSGSTLTIDGRSAAQAKPRDRFGRRLPVWAGCRHLTGGEVLLLNAAPDSLDGRYFGPSRVIDLLGRAQPIWTWGGR